MNPKSIFEALAAGGKGSISVAAACGIAGVIAGTITMTGLANVLINGIVAIAGNQVIIALFLTMVCCIVLGMGVPTTANYCIMAATCAPILVRMGIPMMADAVIEAKQGEEVTEEAAEAEENAEA